MILEGKRILITGASSGIGLELAKEMFIRGSRLFLISRKKGNLMCAVEILNKLNPKMNPLLFSPAMLLI